MDPPAIWWVLLFPLLQMEDYTNQKLYPRLPSQWMTDLRTPQPTLPMVSGTWCCSKVNALIRSSLHSIIAHCHKQHEWTRNHGQRVKQKRMKRINVSHIRVYACNSVSVPSYSTVQPLQSSGQLTSRQLSTAPCQLAIFSLQALMFNTQLKATGCSLNTSAFSITALELSTYLGIWNARLDNSELGLKPLPTQEARIAPRPLAKIKCKCP